MKLPEKKQIQPHHTLDSPKKQEQDATTRDGTTRHDDREEEEEEERKNRVNPDPKTREAASLANAVALPVAVHKTPTPTSGLWGANYPPPLRFHKLASRNITRIETLPQACGVPITLLRFRKVAANNITRTQTLPLANSRVKNNTLELKNC